MRKPSQAEENLEEAHSWRLSADLTSILSLKKDLDMDSSFYSTSFPHPRGGVSGSQESTVPLLAGSRAHWHYSPTFFQSFKNSHRKDIIN